jgi:hypothetical protein
MAGGFLGTFTRVTRPRFKERTLSGAQTTVGILITTEFTATDGDSCHKII